MKTLQELNELLEGINHDRYMRSHGKKAKGNGNWMFTTKHMGDPKDDEVVSVSGKLSDAGKEAMKKLNSKEIYVMESSNIGKTKMARTIEELQRLSGIDESQSSAGMRAKDMGPDHKPGKVKKFSKSEIEAWAKANGMKLVKENLEEAKVDMERVKKGVAFSMKKNDMKAVSKAAKEVLANNSQEDFDAIIDFIIQLTRK